ncbi:hypothetical protein D3C77_493590 [compost metagenome]
MGELIAKLQKYFDDTNAQGTSFECMLEATAWFRRELPSVIDQLHDNEHYIRQLERENRELRDQQDVRIPA